MSTPALLAKKRFGLGNNYTDFIWMTVSTGVGGAVGGKFKTGMGRPWFCW